MIILINKIDLFLTEGKPSTYDETVQGMQNFLKGKPVFEGNEPAPEFITETIPGQGEVKINKGVISIQYDQNTSTGIVNKLLHSIGKEYLNLRQEKSNAYFNKDYFDLTTNERSVIDKVVPMRVFIAEPKKSKRSVQNSNTPPPPPPPAPVDIKVAKDGKLYISEYLTAPEKEGQKWNSEKNKQVSTSELKDYLVERKELCGDRLTVNLSITEGAADATIADAKNIIREAKILKVNYSVEKLEIDIPDNKS